MEAVIKMPNVLTLWAASYAYVKKDSLGMDSRATVSHVISLTNYVG